MRCCHPVLVLILALFSDSFATNESRAVPSLPGVSWQDLMDLEHEHQPVLLEGLVLEGNRHIEIALEPFTILSDIGVVVVENREGTRFLQEEDIVHLYRGQVVGETDSQVFLAATDRHMNGFIRVRDESHHLSTGGFTPWRADHLHVTPFEGSLEDWIEQGPFCKVDEIEQPFAFARPPAQGQGNAPRGECIVVELAVDTDWEYTSNLFGGDADASAAYAMTLSAAVSEIYVTDMQVRIELTYVRTWEDDSDPYVPDGTQLGQLRDHWNDNMSSIQRDVAHLLSSPFSGGLAWLNVVCALDWAYAVSGSLQGSFPYPLEDNSHQNWDLMVVAHELGHNFGTPHTHDLGIDGCGSDPQDCSQAHLGTIMSYCHICPGGLSNIRLGFHELCQNEMYDRFADTSCDESGNCSAGFVVPSLDYPTIQSAIDETSDGDIIEILAGTYFLDATLNTQGKAIQLLGAEPDFDGNPTTIIDGGGDVRLLLCNGPASGDENATFTNLEFRNGGNTPNGGGIVIRDSSPILEFCVFSNCSADDKGGSAYIWSNSNPTFNGCTLKGGSSGSANGGEIRMEDSSATFNQCMFGDATDPNNVSESGYSGGHVSLRNCGLTTFESCTFQHGKAAQQGGSIFAQSSDVLLNGCSFLDCHALAENGGGLSLQMNSHATIQGTEFSQCSVQGSNAGSALYSDEGCNLSLSYCTISGNVADTGGAIHSEGEVSELYLSNSTLCDNSPENITGDPYTDGGGNCLAVTCDDDDGDGVPDACGPPHRRMLRWIQLHHHAGSKLQRRLARRRHQLRRICMQRLQLPGTGPLHHRDGTCRGR